MKLRVNFLFFFFTFLQCIESFEGYQFHFHSKPRSQKSSTFQRICQGVTASTVFTLITNINGLDMNQSISEWSPVKSVNAKVISAPRCDAGQGDGCEALAANSEFLLNLQKKSAENYEKDMKEYLNNYNYNNFKDYFRFKGLELIRHPSDGSFEALTKAEIAVLEKEGKIKDLMFIE